MKSDGEKENEVLESAYQEAVRSVESSKNADTEADLDMDSLLNDALSDFQTGSSSRPTGNRSASDTSRPPPKFDPLHRDQKARSKQSTSSKNTAGGPGGSTTGGQEASSSRPSGGFNPLPSRTGKKAAKKQSGGPQSASSSSQTGSKEQDKQADLAAQLGNLMQELALAEQDVAGGQPGTSGKTGQQEKMSDTLKALSEEAARLQTEHGANQASSSDDIFNEPMFAGLQDSLLRGGDGGADGMGGLADALMRQLVSKDVLQQPLSEIGERYPEWLAKNKDTLSPEDLRNYTQQYQHIQQILDIYEHDADNYGRLFQALHQMQECGQPPDEIVKELAPGMSFGSDGLPKIPGSNTCTIQ